MFHYLSFSQSKEIIYFNKDWKETTKENAAFYRPLPMSVVGKYQLVRDYYINGNLQMQGYSFIDNDKKIVGDVSYYDEFNQENISDDNNLENLNGTFSYFYQDGKLYKTISYKNGELNGINTYYFRDGTKMISGTYENGNCISGSVSCNTKLNSEFRLKKGESEKTITKIIYWENTKQIAQSQTILLKKYSRELIGQQNFDKSGKLIQKLTENAFPNSTYYNESISEGIKFEYYIRNECAINLKSEIHYSARNKNGAYVKYDIDGKIINKIIYKNDLPVEGILEDKLASNIYVFTNYKNSLKDGEEIAKTEKDSIISKGIYKSGKPFSGRLLTENGYGNEDDYLLKNVENFIETGLQQVLNSQNKIIKSYFLKNGLKEGIVTTIDKDNFKSEVEYKNDLPFNGIFKGETYETIYKNGNLVSETEYRKNNPKQISIKKEYENGKIIKVVSSRFDISVSIEKNQNKYLEFTKNNTEDEFQGFTGIYKDEIPFSGFFEKERGEFKAVDYYENGKIKFQYSKDWFSDMNESENQKTGLTLISTFVNGKIVDGNEYFDYNKIKVTKYWQNSIIKTLDVDFFEMHYYNRLHYEIKNNVLEISEILYKDLKMLLDFKNDELEENLVIKNEIIQTPKAETININDQFQANSIVAYLVKDNEIIGIKQSTNQEPNPVLGQYNSSLILKGYYSFVKNSKSKNIQDLFSEIASKFVNDEEMQEKIFRNLDNEDENIKIIGDILIDKNGKPESGILMNKNVDNTYKISKFSKGKLILVKDKIMFKNCISEIDKIQK